MASAMFAPPTRADATARFGIAVSAPAGTLSLGQLSTGGGSSNGNITLQSSGDLTFAFEPLERDVVKSPFLEKLHGDPLVKFTINTNTKIDLTHAVAAEYGVQPIWPDAGGGTRHRISQGLAHRESLILTSAEEAVNLTFRTGFSAGSQCFENGVDCEGRQIVGRPRGS